MFATQMQDGEGHSRIGSRPATLDALRLSTKPVDKAVHNAAVIGARGLTQKRFLPSPVFYAPHFPT
jgi:hypothetical protein